MRSDILTDPELRQRLRGAGVAVVWLFGSRARGEERPDSDADVAVLLRPGVERPSLRVQGTLAGALARALGVESVDFVVLDGAPLDLRGRVVEEGRLLWSDDEPLRVRYTVETLSRYLDVRSTIREQDLAFLAAVARRGL